MEKRGSWASTFGFVMAAAGSAIGLGNIWRFPYLAARGGGGVFILSYLILAVTFGFTLLISEIAIGRKTAQSPLTAYLALYFGGGGGYPPKDTDGKSKARPAHFTSLILEALGVLSCIIPVIILPYYSCVGGWIVKYFCAYLLNFGQTTSAMAQDGYFTGFITQTWQPVLFFIIFLAMTSLIIFGGVNKGIERYSKIIMPLLFLLIIGIAVFSLFLKSTGSDGVTRTGLDGLRFYLLPDWTGMTAGKFLSVLTDAMGQLFYSISVAMGIMITYGSYVPKDANLNSCANKIEIFDTLVALLAGAMIIPAVYVFMGREGMTAGPSLIFVSLPKVFLAMGPAGEIVGVAFFLMVIFAAVTSSVSIMEAIVSSIIDKFRWKRRLAAIAVTLWALVAGVVVCLGYNLFYFDLKLPNGSSAQILDLMDYVSNSVLMPIVAIASCVLIGWVLGVKTITDEVELGGIKFTRKALYKIMVRFVSPLMLAVLLLKSFGLFM